MVVAATAQDGGGWDTAALEAGCTAGEGPSWAGGVTELVGVVPGGLERGLLLGWVGQVLARSQGVKEYGGIRGVPEVGERSPVGVLVGPKRLWGGAG